MSFQLTKITATQLANLSSDKFCPRCFWLLSRLNFKSPFSLFPRIFSELDLFQKSFTESYFKEMGKLPPWLEKYEVKEIVEIPGYGKFGAEHECGVMVTGVTDHVFRMVSDKNLVLDYKTSRPAGDSLFSVYKTQLSIYAWILPRFGLGAVEKMALVYYEPMTAGDWRDKAWLSDPNRANDGVTPDPSVEGLCLNFRPFVMEIEPQDISPLVLRAKALAEQEAMPEPNFHCMECARVMEWAKAVVPTE